MFVVIILLQFLFMIFLKLDKDMEKYFKCILGEFKNFFLVFCFFLFIIQLLVNVQLLGLWIILVIYDFLCVYGKKMGVFVQGDSGDVVWECLKVLDNVYNLYEYFK